MSLTERTEFTERREEKRKIVHDERGESRAYVSSPLKAGQASEFITLKA